MPGPPRSISLQTARRLAVSKQHLSRSPRPNTGPEGILSVLRDLAYVQLDTFSTVVPPQVIALWSRVGKFRLDQLEDLLWRDRKVLEACPEPASYVLAEDYPLLLSLMRGYPRGVRSWWGRRRDRAQRWLDAHDEVVRSVLGQLEGNELPLDQFEGHVPTSRKAEDGWSSASDVARALAYLHMRGEVMVVGREGNQKVWGIPADFLPSWVDRTELSWEEVERRAVHRALAALGTGSAPEVYYYFPRGKYVGLRETLGRLEREGEIREVRVAGTAGKERRYIREQDLPLLDAMESKDWKGRLALLSPYDNLIAGTSRTERLFGFHYTHGNYLPAANRRYGLYVLPILWEDQIIGRLDPSLDRATHTLHIHSVHAEPEAPTDQDVARAIARTVEELASFVRADEVRYSRQVPAAWKSALR